MSCTYFITVSLCRYSIFTGCRMTVILLFFSNTFTLSCINSLCLWSSIYHQAGLYRLRNTRDIQSLYCEEPSSSWPSSLMTQGLKFIVRPLMILWVWCTFIKWRVLLPFYLHVHLGYIRRTYSRFALNSWCEMEVKMHFVWRWIKAKRYANITFSSC
jgi:hypothetical protein